MLIEIILFLLCIYFFYHGLYPLITHKPVFKFYELKQIIIFLVSAKLFILLINLFLFFVKNYAISYANITLGNQAFYALFVLFCIIVLWIYYQHESEIINFKQSVTLIAVDPTYALSAVTKTLIDLNTSYRETLSGFEIPDKNIIISVTTNNNQIFFSVSRALDKIYLKQFCRAYQALYQNHQYPLKRKSAILSTLLGLTFSIALLYFIYLPFNFHGSISWVNHLLNHTQ